MIGIDTNILVRVLVNDTDALEQCNKARMLLLKHKEAFITTVVLVETIWVIQRAYKVGKKRTIKLVDSLLLQTSIILENTQLIEQTITIYSAANIDFSDACILASNLTKHCHLYTFDKKLGEHSCVTNINDLDLN